MYGTRNTSFRADFGLWGQFYRHKYAEFSGHEGALLADVIKMLNNGPTVR